MGLLVGEKSETLDFPHSRKYQRLLKSNAARQLARLLHKFEKFEKDPLETLKYGTELESHLLFKKTLPHGTFYPVYTNSKDFMAFVKTNFKEVGVQEEFASWMVELLPDAPFFRFLSFAEVRKHFLDIEKLAASLPGGPILVSGLSVLPHVGTLHYHLKAAGETVPMAERKCLNVYSQSDYFLDETITDHSRFRSLTLNTRLRRQSPVSVVMPVLQDPATLQKTLTLDHFGFGMCNTALQITYSCQNLAKARLAHDLMHVVSPFMLAFSSSIFALNGRLVDADCRLRIIEQSTDDRSPRERDRIEKSRYGTINYFISNDPRCRPEFNDKKYTLNQTFRKTLQRELRALGSGLARDRRLLNHFAYLFVRDFLVVFPERCVPGYAEDTLEFEGIQSSNWQNMRLKPPGSFDSGLGWLVEFRCMDSPITEREKSALVFVVTLFFRIVNDEKLGVDFYMPISEVDRNFAAGMTRDALTAGRFRFRKNFCRALPGFEEDAELEELTLAEFWAGTPHFAGMRALFARFIELNAATLVTESLAANENIVQRIWTVYEFFLARAKGELMASPRFFREFVRKHPDYKHDSVLSDAIVADVIEKVVEIQRNNYQLEMFGDFKF